MKCSCIRGTYDFFLDQTQCSNVIYLDHSTWQEGPDYGTPTYTLSIEDNGGNITEHSVTQGVPLYLDLSCSSGVYTFSVVSCLDTFTKDVAILCSLECGYLKATAKLGRGVEVETLRSIRERIDFIKQSVGFGDIDTARDLTQSVEFDLKQINCSCKC